MARTVKVYAAVDWDEDGGYANPSDDVSSMVQSVELDRSITSDVPDEASLVTGFIATETTLTLGSDDLSNKEVIEFFSAVNPASPLYLKERIGSRLKVGLDFFTSAGVERIMQMDGGRLRTVTLNRGEQQVILVSLDRREDLRSEATYPTVVADDNSTLLGVSKRAGLNAQWLIDYLLRKAGYYASPPVRASCILAVTMHGSAYPEVGSLVYVHVMDAGSNIVGPAAFAAGSTGLLAVRYLDPDGAELRLQYTLAKTAPTVTGSSLFLQCWLQAVSASLIALPRMEDEGAFNFADIRIPADGSVTVQVFRDGFTSGVVTVAAAGSFPRDGAEHYLGASFTYTSTGGTARIRIGSADFSAAFTVGGGSTGGPLTQITQYDPGSPDYRLRDLQVTTEPYVSTMWDNAFTPTAILDSSSNELTATAPTPGQDVWNCLKDLADAEQGIIQFTEDGIFRFWNSNHMLSQPAVATLQVDVKDLQLEESIDTVRNRINVPVRPLRVKKPGWVWSSPTAYKISANDKTTIWATWEDGSVPYNISTVWNYLSAGETGHSGYRATTAADGTGAVVSNLHATITIFQNSVKIVVRNPNVFKVWLVNPSGMTDDQGSPGVYLWGQIVSPDPKSVDNTPSDTGFGNITYVDNVSIQSYGEQVLDMNENKWVQSSATGQALAELVGSRLRHPMLTIINLTIKGRPELQLGDRVLIVDSSAGSTKMSANFWIVGITSNWAKDNGLEQTLTLRGYAGFWLLGVAGQSEIGQTTFVR
jgi:hypothetical protein